MDIESLHHHHLMEPNIHVKYNSEKKEIEVEGTHFSSSNIVTIITISGGDRSMRVVHTDDAGNFNTKINSAKRKGKIIAVDEKALADFEYFG